MNLFKKPNRKSIAAGFTLIEIMLTVVIVSFGLVLVIRSLVTALGAMERSKDASAASFLLEEKMEEIKEKAKEDKGIAVGQDSGKFPAIGERTYQWSLNITSSRIDEALNEGNLVVSWKEGRKDRNVSAASYFENKPEEKSGIHAS